MFISKLESENLTVQQMTNLLFTGIEDDKNTGDCIFVAGSSTAVHYRLPKAIELYKQGRAPKILFSGGVKWNGNGLPEAMILKNKAMALGIPEKDILTEDQSLHTLENVLASLLVLSRAFQLHQMERILIVTTAYHMRRLHLTMKTYMPNWINFSLCPAIDQNTRKDNWFRSVEGRKRVEAECTKIINYVKKGALKDEDIKLSN
ncbi:YdcF family protein [Oceanobacillus salinisoli]|uniref:YdcF family protein n=1 Tax=Oceanobacillus salinisoli TaxID=2678611 RepID=UPI0012E1E9C3|nr:YdcF family protein [Oceanobacillus salinisoli]